MAEYLAENARLRQLSRRHSEGQLSSGEFRAARREILEALEAGQVDQAPPEPVPVPEHASSTLVRDASDDEAVFLKTMPPQVPVAAVEEATVPVAVALGWDGHTRVLAAVLGVALLLALGALFYVFAL